MFEYLFNTTFNVSLAEYLFIGLLGAAVYGLAQLARDYARAFAWDSRHRRAEEPEPVVPAEPQPAPEPAPAPVFVQAWSEAGFGPEPYGVPVQPGHRLMLELESAPMAPRLPKCPSLVNFKDFNLADPEHTAAWQIIGGYDEEDMKDAGVVGTTEPWDRARSHFPRLNPLERAAVAEALPKSRHRLSKKAVVDVDLEAGTVTVPS